MKHHLSFLILLLVGALGCEKEDGPDPFNPAGMDYNMTIDPGNFVSANLTGNTYFPIMPGAAYVYEGLDEDDIPIRVEINVLNQTRTISGVTCAIFEFKEYEDGDLVELTQDWYAQDLDGNVWYFGELAQEIKNGEVVSTEGSWESGVDGALPGIIMLAKPIVGMWYRQEYREGEAEDVAQVMSINQTVTVPFGTFTNCIVTAEWNPLEPGILEHDYYAPGIGSIREAAVKGEKGFEELVSFTP